MKIIVDAFGGDNAPLEILKGCVSAVSEYGIDVILVGNKKELEEVIEKNSILMYHMTIADAKDIITMNDDPASIMKFKKNSSMAVGLKMLANGEGDAFVSAGNSGALVFGATMIVKRIKGIKRSAFAPVMPKDQGFFMLIDSGANVECRPEMLRQFGIMGSVYMEKVMGVENPRVGLANVGTEEHKGGSFQHETYKLLKESPVNFVGNVEARDIPVDAADVIVTDGFTGNIILKLYEGVSMTLLSKIKEVLQKSFKTKLAGAMILSDMRELKKQIDYNEFGGAPVMGISKPVFKIHGNAEAKAVKSAIGLTCEYVRRNVIKEIESVVGKINSKDKESED